MTLKEELEILRGEPIQVFSGDPMEIPCIETSDPEKLCKHPVVSVSMITYNHEPYIRQAIEGVMMQETDFEFELVIGEDCSTDKTREICFEYQKKFPDKIRVLWWHENLYRKPHPAGGNGARNRAHCRGEFIALCEGDDYWTDLKKLQTQVDVMRRYPSVGLCLTNAIWYGQDSGSEVEWPGARFYSRGFIDGRTFLSQYLFGADRNFGRGPESFLTTASLIVRSSILKNASQRYEVFSWQLALGDTPLIAAMASLADLYYLDDKMVVYRRTRTGAMGTQGDRVGRDANVARLFFTRACKGLLRHPLPASLLQYVIVYYEHKKRSPQVQEQFRSVVARMLETGEYTLKGKGMYDRVRFRVFLSFGCFWQFHLRDIKILMKIYLSFMKLCLIVRGR